MHKILKALNDVGNRDIVVQGRRERDMGKREAKREREKKSLYKESENWCWSLEGNELIYVSRKIRRNIAVPT